MYYIINRNALQLVMLYLRVKEQDKFYLYAD